MSFILDALRKSEHARQRQTGPGLADVPVVVQHPKSNVWATAAVALLVVNLLAVGILLLHRAQKEDAAAPAVAAAPTAASATSAGNVAPGSTPVPALTNAARPGMVPSETRPPIDDPAISEPAGAPVARNPLAAELGGSSPSADVLDPTLAEGAASVPAGPRAVTSARRGSVVYAPVPEAADMPYAAPPPGVPAGAAPGTDTMPTADEVTAKGGVPELHLDLHVFAAAPQQRFIFVNSRKYKEGETLQEGPVVEQITRDGAVLAYRGSRFKLSND